MKEEKEVKKGFANGTKTIRFNATKLRGELITSRNWHKFVGGADGKKASISAVALAAQNPMSIMKEHLGGRVTLQYNETSWFEGWPKTQIGREEEVTESIHIPTLGDE